MKHLFFKVLLSTFFVFFLSAHTLYAAEKNDFSLGINYALTAQTNDYGPVKSMGNAIDISGEYHIFPFLSLFIGYQFMSYNWEDKPKETELFTNKLLLGGRLQFSGLFVGGGAYSSWNNLSNSLAPEAGIKNQYWGGYVDFGYNLSISKNISLETGSRFYFLGEGESKLLTSALTGNVSKDGTTSYQWDWFVGIKYIV